MTKRVLLIAHDFPPAGGPGVQRPAKFVKYLPQFGWQPLVLTVTPAAYPVLDATLMADIPPDTPVYRQKGYDVRTLRPTFEKLHLSKVLSGVNAALLLPDAAMFWARFARSTVRNIIEEHQPDILFSTSPPASAHLLGQWTHRTFGLPWVADFRDPWSENPLHPYLPGYKSINRRQEQNVLRSAQMITTVSPPLVDFIRRASEDEELVINIIENGYDADDVTRWPQPDTSKFTILYTGAFSRIRKPDAFVKAVDMLVDERRIPLGEFRVVLAGNDIENFIPDRAPFEFRGYLTHTELDDLRRDSDLLLLILNPLPMGRGNFSGKLFEYLASNRPTLAITHPENVAAQLIQRVRAGMVVNHNPAQIADAISVYFKSWQTRRFDYEPDWTVIEQFSRYNLTKRLSSIFDDLTSN